MAFKQGGTIMVPQDYLYPQKKNPISNTLYAFNDFQIYNKDLDFEKLQV